MAAGAASFAGTLLANGVLARLLTPAELGAYFLVITLVTSVVAAAALGLPRAVVRLVAGHLAMARPGEAVGTLVSAVRSVVAAGVVAAAVTATWPGRWIVSSVWETPLLEGVLVLAAVMIGAEAVRVLLSESLRGLHDYRSMALTGEGARAGVTALAIAALAVVVDQTDLRTAVVLTMAASVTVAAVAAALLLSRVRRLRPRRRVALAPLLALSLPLMVHDVTNLLLNSGDLWIIGAARTPRDVAVYAAAVRVVMLVRVPMFLLSQALAPTISELHAVGDRRRLERMVRGAACIAAIPTLLLVPAGVFFGESVLRVVFGDFYAQGATVLVILSIGEAANGLTGPTAITLSMTGQQRVLMGCSVVALAVTLSGELLLVGPFGLPGVAVASAGGVALFHGMLALVIRRRLGIWTLASPRALRG